MSEEYIIKLEQINRALRTQVKKEVADNYDRLIARIDELSVKNNKLRECVERIKNKDTAIVMSNGTSSKYNNYEQGWNGVAEYADQCLKEIEVIEK